jgi:hypothetical protein
MMDDFKYHFTVTLKTDDEAVLHCLRGLSHYAQRTGKKMATWGGTGKGEWVRDHHCVKFRFSSDGYRNKFIEEASRLFSGKFEKVGVEDK